MGEILDAIKKGWENAKFTKGTLCVREDEAVCLCVVGAWYYGKTGELPPIELIVYDSTFAHAAEKNQADIDRVYAAFNKELSDQNVEWNPIWLGKEVGYVVLNNPPKIGYGEFYRVNDLEPNKEVVLGELSRRFVNI